MVMVAVITAITDITGIRVIIAMTAESITALDLLNTPPENTQ